MKRLLSYSVSTTKVLLAAMVTMGVFSCTKDLYVPPTENENQIGEVTLDNYFDFATTKMVDLNINYGKECSKAYFEIYAENPLSVKDNQVVRRTDLIALASGFANTDGIYNAKASIPSSVSKAYIYSPDFGVPTLFVADVINNAISAEITFDNAIDLTTMVNTRSVTRASVNAIKQYIPNVLGTWNASSGKPNYLDETKKIKVSEDLKKYITGYFPEGGNNTGSGFITDDADLLVKEDANLWINYFGGTTGAQSTFAYYCYAEGASPEVIKAAAKNACVIFPSAHQNSLGAYSGVAVKLKYISGKGLTDVFPANTRIGFLIWNNAWIGGNGGAFDRNVFYSTASLNRDGRSHTAVFSTTNEKEGEQFNVITMEDWEDTDYNDLAFVIQSNPVGAIVVPPAVKPDDRKGTDVYRGLLCYEDNWPNQGDYDMNDMVMKYVTNVDYNYDNNIIAITDKFTLSWAGANYNNGFAYELPFDVEKTGAEITNVTGAGSYSLNGNVITLFTDAKAELGIPNMDASDMPNHPINEVVYTISIAFKNPSISKVEVLPPYNPFLKKYGGNEEVHLTNFKPSPYATNVFDQSGADISDGVETFFICKDGFPFAVHLDARTDESVLNVGLKEEKKRIDKVYPLFVEWALTRDPNVKWWVK